MDRTELTEAQRDGIACVRCHREDTAMVPTGSSDISQTFQCAQDCTTTVYLILTPTPPNGVALLGTAPTQIDAFRQCENREHASQDGDLTFDWYPIDETDTDGAYELYVTLNSDTHQTGYTVVPLIMNAASAIQAEHDRIEKLLTERSVAVTYGGTDPRTGYPANLDANNGYKQGLIDAAALVRRTGGDLLTVLNAARTATSIVEKARQADEVIKKVISKHFRGPLNTLDATTLFDLHLAIRKDGGQ